MLKIAATSRWRRPLAAAPEDLKAEVRDATGRSFRRINRFIELALLGSARCAAAAASAPPPDAALVLCTEAGMSIDVSRVLVSMAAEQRGPAPFEFVNISGAMAGFNVAQNLGLRGPQLTLHRNHASLEAGLQLLALPSAPQRQALIGFVEEGYWPEQDLRLRLEWPEGALAECSHWLYLDEACAAPLATIASCTRHATLAEVAAAVAGRDGVVLAGSRRNRSSAPLEIWAEKLGIGKILELSPAPLYSGGLPIEAICRFVDERPARVLLLVNQAAEDEFFATVVELPAG